MGQDPIQPTSLVVQWVKNLPANAGDIRDTSSIPWRRKWQSILVFLSGESCHQDSLEAAVHGVTEELAMKETEHSTIHPI